MKINGLIGYLSAVATLSLMGGFAVPPAHAAGQASATSASAPAQTPSIASGAAEDTLKACLVRIPKDASAGQRMMAEQGCERDAGSRELMDAVPGR